MAETSVAHGAHPPTTRELRGLRLYRERGDRIEPLGHGKYRVPGCSGGSYEVDLAVLGDEEDSSCMCRDHRKGRACKHIYAATLYRAKRRAEHRRSPASGPRFSPEQVEANLERMGA